MDTKYKAALLELVAGLFGWVWIAASIAALYFLVIAVFSDGKWTQFFWAAGISVVAKWLARGFDDSKKKVGIEAKLIEQGDSLSLKPPDHIVEIIHAYGETLESSAPAPGCVADEGKLPFPKKEIKEAIIDALRYADDEKMRNGLIAGYIQLADWQRGVGDSNQGLDISSIDDKQDVKTIADAIVQQTSGSEKWIELARQEEGELVRELKDLGLWKDA